MFTPGGAVEARARLAAQLRVSFFDSLVRLKSDGGCRRRVHLVAQRDASGVVVGIVRGTTTGSKKHVQHGRAGLYVPRGC